VTGGAVVAGIATRDVPKKATITNRNNKFRARKRFPEQGRFPQSPPGQFILTAYCTRSWHAVVLIALRDKTSQDQTYYVKRIFKIIHNGAG